jgi:hypothetical protein
MKAFHLSAAALLAGLVAGGAQAAPAVTGDYVESRSANIYVGACHREGEMLTVGRNAVLAWDIKDGAYNGVELKGVRAMAVVGADKHLDFTDAKRQSAIYVSSDATPAQRDAVVAMLKDRAAKALGEVVGVRSAPIAFDAGGDMYRVQIEGIAFMKIKKQVGELCCKQPYELWSKPFVSVKAPKAGYCVGVSYKDASLLQTWSATDQNNAFFGEFSL